MKVCPRDVQTELTVVFEFSARATASLTIFDAGFETAQRTERGATALGGSERPKR